MLRTLLFLFTLVTLTAFAIPAFAQTATNVPATTPDPLFLGDGFTYLKSDIDRVTLVVCAPNIQPGVTVYALAFRDALQGGSISARHWHYVQPVDEGDLMSLRAPDGTFHENQCVLFDGEEDAASEAGMSGMEGSGSTFPATVYYVQVTLVNTLGMDMRLGPLAEFGRETCLEDSGDYVLCDQVTSPEFIRPGYNDGSI